MRTLISELQQQRKQPTTIHHDEDKIAQARILLAESNKQMVENRVSLCHVSIDPTNSFDFQYESQLVNVRRQLEESESNKTSLSHQVCRDFRRRNEDRHNEISRFR